MASFYFITDLERKQCPRADLIEAFCSKYGWNRGDIAVITVEKECDYCYWYLTRLVMNPERSREMTFSLFLRENGSSPGNIGGRSTDLSLIHASLYELVQAFYPINAVPEEVCDRLEELEGSLRGSENHLAYFLDFMKDKEA